MSNVGIISRTGDDIATEIMMVGLSLQAPVLIVEGPTDEIFFSARVVPSCYIAIGSDKRTVVKALEALDAASVLVGRPIVGVVDEDYDWASGEHASVPSLIKTDPRDLEGVLFRSRAVQCVLAEYVDREALKALESAEGQSILAMVLARAEEFGRIRMVSVLGPRIDLSKWKPVRYCLPDWTYDMARAKHDVVQMGVASSVDDLESRMAGLSFPSQWHAVRGHDLVDIFCGLLIYKLGAPNARVPSIEAILRQAMSAAELDACLLGQRLRTWEAANSPLFA